MNEDRPVRVREDALYIYKNPGTCFGKCSNCGERCKVPGVLLPEKTDVLADHFNIDRRQLFERYLIGPGLRFVWIWGRATVTNYNNNRKGLI